MSKHLWYQRESFNDSLRHEIRWLLQDHWREVGHYQDIPLCPDWTHYENAHRAGILYIFTARDSATWNLVGYAVFFVRPNPHYKTSWQAAQDILFIHPDYRGQGGRFIAWCDAQLAAELVQAVYHHVKVAHNFGPLLERMGYELVDLVYARRLDRGRDSNDSQRGGDDRLDGVRAVAEAEGAEASGDHSGCAAAAAVRRDAAPEAAGTAGSTLGRLDGRDDPDGAERHQPIGRNGGGRRDERPSSAEHWKWEQQEDAVGHLTDFAETMDRLINQRY